MEEIIGELLELVAEKSLRLYGFANQSDKTVEELNELAVALMHYKFKKCDYMRVLEEAADVYITCAQVIMHFDLDKFSQILRKKLTERLTFLTKFEKEWNK